MDNETARFRDQAIVFADGTVGEDIDIPSASPVNYFQVISAPAQMPRLTIDGKLFLPSGAERPVPAVVVVPGSLGVAPSHIAHAETLCGLGIATCILDSFGARQVTSTVADQTQFSFAASAYDVLAAFELLASHPDIDRRRIGAQGHSRGGSAVLTAANRCFATAVVGEGEGLAGVLAAYPWSGQQFLDPSVGNTEVRVLMGDRDEWCLPAHVQAHCHAITLTGGAATMRLVGGAQHSFDRGTAVVDVPEAAIAPCAPLVYLAEDGAMVHPLDGSPNPALVDRDVMVYALKAGYGRRGARIGSGPGEADLFRDDMVAFWRRVLGLGANAD